MWNDVRNSSTCASLVESAGTADALKEVSDNGEDRMMMMMMNDDDDHDEDDVTRNNESERRRWRCF